MENLSSIERSIHVKAPRERVWRALTAVQEFSKWFGVEIQGGEIRSGAKLKMVHAGVGYVFDIQEMRPPESFSWRWHPGMIDNTLDYSKEPMTLITFTLLEADGGTRVTVLESGFDAINLARRASVFAENLKGWEEQMVNLERYLGVNR